MNELEAKCYLTKKGGANNSDHTCTHQTLKRKKNITENIVIVQSLVMSRSYNNI